MALTDETLSKIAFKNLSGKSHTDNAKGLGNEAEGIFLNIPSNAVFMDEINDDPSIAISDGVAEEVLQADLVSDPTSNGHAYFLQYPTGHPKVGERITNAISPSYGFQYSIKIYDSLSNSIPVNDPRDWIHQYNSGIFYQQDNVGNTPSKADIYVYVGQTLDELNSTSSNSFDSLSDTPNSKTGSEGSLVRVNSSNGNIDYSNSPIIFTSDSNSDRQSLLDNSGDKTVYFMESDIILGHDDVSLTIKNDRTNIKGLGKTLIRGINSSNNIFNLNFTNTTTDKVIVFENLIFDSTQGRLLYCDQILTSNSLTIIFDNCEFIGNTNTSNLVGHIYIDSPDHLKLHFINCKNTSNIGQTRQMSDPTRFMFVRNMNTFDIKFDDCDFSYGRGAFLDVRQKSLASGVCNINYRNSNIYTSSTINEGTGSFLFTTNFVNNSVIFINIENSTFDHQSSGNYNFWNFRYGNGSSTIANINYRGNNIFNWKDSTNYISAPNTIVNETGEGTLKFNGDLIYNGLVTSLSSKDDKFLLIIPTINDNELASSSGISNTPKDGSYVDVRINGVDYEVGDADKTKSGYFSSDNGLTAKSFSSSHPNGKIVAGDKFYWNSNITGIELEYGWRLSFHYLV